VVAELLCSEDADRSLTALESAAPADYERLAATLAEFDAGPSDARWKRRRYANPPVFGFTVIGRGGTYLVLWSSVGDTAIVEYVGPDI